MRWPFLSHAAGVLFLTAALQACAPKTGGPDGFVQDGEDVPAWKTEEGRRSAWRELARWYIDNKRPDEALEMVKRLRDAGEDTVELRLIQARALTAQGVPDESAHLLESIVKEAPKDPEVWSSLGIVYVDLQRTPDAIAAFRKAIDLGSEDAATRNNLGFLLFATGECEASVDHFEKAMAADGTNARYRNNLAFALVCTGDAERALKLLRSTSATEADARYDMGLAYERLDRVPSAILQYRAALEADPQHAAALEAIERLETPEASTDASPGTEAGTGTSPGVDP
jgi:Flp pilus assembly protein TadD